jgi:hypothetical protein
MMGELAATEGAPACALADAKVFGPVHSPDLPDWATPLDDPRWVTPAEAVLMRDQDTVLGFEAAGRVWAIPWWVMKNHHVANLTLEGRPFLVTLCEACVAGGVFDPLIDGRRAWFQNNGWYPLGALMTDDLTGSLWLMAHGRCVAGPHQGMALPMRPIVHARWREWATMCPQTLVVDGEGEPRDGHGAHCWAPDHPGGKGGNSLMRGIGRAELVASIELGESRRGYLLDTVHDLGGIVEDTVDGCPIVVVTLPGTWLCVAFVAEAEGAPVELCWDRTEDPPIHLIDQRSGWRFDLWGRCVTEGHRELRLPYVRSTLVKWRAWAGSNRNSELSRPGVARATIS